MSNRTVSKPSQTAYSYQVAVKGDTPPASSTPASSRAGNNTFERNLVSADNQTLIKHSQKDNPTDEQTLIKHPQRDKPGDEQT